MGYNPEPTIRTALSYMGLNPDNMLVRNEPTPPPAMPEGGMPMAGGMPEMPPMPPQDMNNPLAQIQNLGGSINPAAMEGGTI